jgi:hypothetical protein
MPSSIPRVYLVAGTLEPFFLENATRWAAALRDAGAEVLMNERVASHGAALWQAEFPLIVAWAFGRGSTALQATRGRIAATGRSVGVHLQERYGIEVTGVVGLDAGVFRVDRRDGPSWVARVFPARRAVADVEAEAELLRALDQPAGHKGPADAIGVHRGRPGTRVIGPS